MNQLKIYVAILLALSGMAVQAQENIVKAGITGALLGDYNLGFERRVTGKQSFHFKVGFIEPTTSLVIPEEAFAPKAYTLLESSGGISTSLEYRFYVSKKEGLRGFYIAPYLRYFNQSILFEDEIEGEHFTVDTRLSTSGIGGQMGYQWIIKKAFTIDFSFFGTGIDFHKAELKYVLESIPEGFDYTMVTPHVENAFEDLDFLNKNLTHEVRDDSHISRIPVRLPGFRAGLSIGMAF